MFHGLLVKIYCQISKAKVLCLPVPLISKFISKQLVEKSLFALPCGISKDFKEYFKQICGISIKLDINKKFEKDISVSI